MPKKVVLRSCTVCRNKIEKKDLLRIVRSPEGEISLDLQGKKPGRGAYLCANQSCIEKAKQSKRLDTVLEVKIPDEIFDTALEIVLNGK